MYCNKKNKSLLSLMQLVSSAFPIGAFSYSRGLEWAVECGWVNSVETFSNWQKQWINGQLLYLEWPMIRLCYHYVKMNDPIRFFQCALKIVSYRDTYEMRLEERERGKAMAQLISQWYFPVDKYWVSGLKSSGLASIAWLGYMWKISVENVALGYAYSVLESSVMAGLKLVPFGQNTAQGLLRYFIECLISAWNPTIVIGHDKLGSSFPMQSIASVCHETQYSRLFRS